MMNLLDWKLFPHRNYWLSVFLQYTVLLINNFMIGSPPATNYAFGLARSSEAMACEVKVVHGLYGEGEIAPIFLSPASLFSKPFIR